jgi:hypothetical protein
MARDPLWLSPNAASQILAMHTLNSLLAPLHKAFLAFPFCFMGTNRPKDCEELFPNGTELQSSVSHWTKDVLKGDVAAQCDVLTIKHYKQDGGMDHEFITIEFRHPFNVKNFIRVDRSVEQTSSVSLVSSSPSPAHDRVVVSSDGVEHKLLPQFPQTYLLRTLKFPSHSLSVADLAIILRIICELAPHYHLYKSQCYWFVAATWEGIKALFPYQENLISNNKRPGYYRNVKVDCEIPTNIIVQRYRQELHESREGATQRQLQQERVSLLKLWLLFTLLM